jgi:hypothetical protein
MTCLHLVVWLLALLQCLLEQNAATAPSCIFCSDHWQVTYAYSSPSTFCMFLVGKQQTYMLLAC